MDDISFLIGLQQELNTQPHDYQASPIFWTIYDYKLHVTEEGYGSHIRLYERDACEEYEIMEFLQYKLEETELSDEDMEEVKEIIKNEDESEAIDWISKNCSEVDLHHMDEIGFIVPNTMFLTKSEAIAHLEANSHHYTKKAHTYAMTAWRSPTVERLIDILKTFKWETMK